VDDRDDQKVVRRAGAQPRLLSLVEAATNVVVGFALAVLTQMAVFPLLGLAISMTDNVLIGVIFTAVSIVRSFTLRRLFERLRSVQWDSGVQS